jgi:hypothetical protein
VLAISPKQLIAAHSREQNRRLLAGFAAHQICRDDGRVSRGFVHVPDEFRQQVGDVGLYHNAMIFAAELPRQSSCNLRIVERGLAYAIFFRKRLIIATMLEESRPALRKAPIGTSLTICASTDRRKRPRTSSARSSSDRA